MVGIRTCSIEQTQRVRFATDHYSYRVVIENLQDYTILKIKIDLDFRKTNADTYGWHILRRELIRSIGNQETGFTDGSIAHDNAFYGLHD